MQKLISGNNVALRRDLKRRRLRDTRVLGTMPLSAQTSDVGSKDDAQLAAHNIRLAGVVCGKGQVGQARSEDDPSGLLSDTMHEAIKSLEVLREACYR